MAKINADLINWLPQLARRIQVDNARHPDEALVYAERSAFNLWLNLAMHLLNEIDRDADPATIEAWTIGPGKPVSWKRGSDGMARPNVGTAPVVVGGELKRSNR